MPDAPGACRRCTHMHAGRHDRCLLDCTFARQLLGFSPLNQAHPRCRLPLLQLLYPATLYASAAILAVISQAATLALPASQLFVAAEDRGRVLRDFRVSTLPVVHGIGCADVLDGLTCGGGQGRG
jgi:hypothetical protein